VTLALFCLSAIHIKVFPESVSEHNKELYH